MLASVRCRILSASLQSTNIKIYRTIILRVVLYGCETWSQTPTEELRLRVFETRVLRIFGPKRDEITGEWRKLHNEELNDLNSSSIIIRVIKMRWRGHVERMGRGEERCIQGVSRKPEGKRPLGRPWRRWEDIKMVFTKWDEGAWSGLIWLRTPTSSGHL
jgi:hypothetical protein